MVMGTQSSLARRAALNRLLGSVTTIRNWAQCDRLAAPMADLARRRPAI